MALDAIAEQVDVTIEESHIDAEIRNQWTNNEGRFLMEKGTSRRDLDDALQSWLTDENTREIARNRLKIAAVMMMYTIADPAELTADEIEGFFRDYATRNDIDYDQWRKSLEGKDADQVERLCRHLAEAVETAIA